MKIVDVAIPGTHNSGAYKITKFHTQNKTLQALSRFFIMRHFMSRITLTQNKNIKQQIADGIRFLDIRVSKHQDEYYVSHTFLCDKLDVVLEDIKKSLQKDNYVLVDFRVDYENKENISVNEIYEHIMEFPIPVIFADEFTTEQECYGKIIIIKGTHKWANTYKHAVLKKFIEYERNKKSNFRVIHAVFTPQLMDCIIAFGSQAIALIVVLSYAFLQSFMYLHIILIVIFTIIGHMYSLKYNSYKANSLLKSIDSGIYTVDFYTKEFILKFSQ